MQMTYKQPKTSTLYQYTVQTDPPEATYWETFKLLKSHIKLLTKTDNDTKKKITQEIYDDILSREPNPRTNRASNNEVQEKRPPAKSANAKTRKTKRKAW
jgi:hypothetical protein